jgi:hypothetical protein
MRASREQFIRQQGFLGPDFLTDAFYAALMFQPNVVTGMTVAGVLLQSPWIFFALAAVLWWNALVPTRNPFTAIYNRITAGRPGFTRLGAAPDPRRFAEGMGGTVAMAIGVALVAAATYTAWALEVVMTLAALAVVFRDFCGGAALYHLLHGTAHGKSVRYQ